MPSSCPAWLSAFLWLSDISLFGFLLSPSTLPLLKSSSAFPSSSSASPRLCLRYLRFLLSSSAVSFLLFPPSFSSSSPLSFPPHCWPHLPALEVSSWCRCWWLDDDIIKKKKKQWIFNQGCETRLYLFLLSSGSGSPRAIASCLSFSRWATWFKIFTILWLQENFGNLNSTNYKYC